MKSLITSLRRFSKRAIIRRRELIQRDIVVRPNPEMEKTAKLVDSLMTNADGVKPPQSLTKVDNLMSIKPSDAFKALDTTIETFFQTRDTTTRNFNLLLQSLSARGEFDRAELVFRKMDAFRARPNPGSYAILISLCGKCNRIEKAEKYFDEADERFGANKVLYNALIHAYSRVSDATKAEATWRQARRAGLVPDAAMLTSLVNAFLHARQPQKAWLYFGQRTELAIEPDDVLLGLMVRACTLDGSAEKALLIFEEIRRLPQVRMTCLHYNALLRALASRKDYAQQAVGVYETMKSFSIHPDVDTFIALLTATAKLGDVATAFNAMVQMNQVGIRPRAHVVGLLLETYAAALAAPRVPRKLKELYLADSWKLLEQFLESQHEHLSPAILDAMLRVHLSADKGTEGEELVLPLFEKFGLARTAQTHAMLIKAAVGQQDLIKATKIFNIVRKGDSHVSAEILNDMLNVFVRLRDVPGVIDVLKTFRERNGHPSRHFLNQVMKMSNIPDDLFELMASFEHADRLLRRKRRSYEGDTADKETAELMHKDAHKLNI